MARITIELDTTVSADRALADLLFSVKPNADRPDAACAPRPSGPGRQRCARAGLCRPALGCAHS